LSIAPIGTHELRRFEQRLQAALGPRVRVVCTGTDGNPDHLWPQEQRFIGPAIARRQREFAAGRAAVRLALRSLGWPACAIPAREDRSPVWPDGLVGSITHNSDICVVVLARQDDCASLGIDLESDSAVDASVWSSLCTAWELGAIGQAGRSLQAFVATRFFTAKEAFYKWQFQTTGSMLDFNEVEVRPMERDRFGVYPVSRLARSLFGAVPTRGQWVNEKGLSLACIGHD